VTTFFYDGLGNVINRTAHLPNGSVQETEYDYGTTADTTPTLDTDSLISSSGLLRAVRYPNESTGLAGTTAAYTVTYGYNRLGELRGMSDQNGTTHAYTRDALGRVTLDTVTAFGTDIDQAVDSIATAYDDHGRVASVQSKDGSTVVNEVGFGYTKLHQIETLTQNAFGGIGGAAAKDVVYAYDNAIRATGSTGNYSRLASIRYPNEDGATDPTVEYGYGASGSIGDRIGRVAGMDVPGWTSTNTDLVDYTYLGGSTPVRVNYPSTTHGLGLDAIKAKKGTDGASTGTYHAFDRFGRVVYHAWVTDGFTTGTNPNMPDRTPLFARAYEYDMDSNRELDYDARPGAVRNDRDWEYQYDGLDRLKQADRGRESGGFTLAADSQQWGLDILGNWKTFGTDANANGTFENTLAERQNRTHNFANEITLQEKPNGMSSQILTQPAYDDAGNYRQNLGSGTSRLIYTHDAWNRLVRVTRSSGSHTVLENAFNGLNWRVRRHMDLSQGAYNGVDEARTYYYSANWQVLEEHVDTDPATDGSDSDAILDNDSERIGQQFWGVRYIDDAVARRVDRDGDGTFSGASEDNFFYLTDVMFSVRAVVDGDGLLHTRLDYTPYGVAMHGKAADVNGDGALTFTDISLASLNANGGMPLEPGDANYDPDADLWGAGADYASFLPRYTDYSPGPTFNAGWIDNPGDVNGPDNSVGYDGYFFDMAGATQATSTGLYMVRHRVYDPQLGRWLSRDPAGYLAADNLFCYVSASPARLLDSLGLAPYEVGTTPPPDASDALQAASDATYNTGTDLTLLEVILIEKKAKATIAGGVLRGYVNAARHLSHFLYGGGATYTIKFKSMNRESRQARLHMVKEINDALDYGERLAKEGAWTDIVTTTEVWATPGNQSGDWLYAVGEYRTWAEGRVIKCGSRYIMDWTFHFRDFYDWDINSPLDGGLVSDREMALLHRSPMSGAKEYRMIGSHSMSFEWKEGERYDTGADISGDGRPPRRRR
tara:strand:+ start:8981 stop:11971 length:2991 start_codon:yes stop_codon:yes gene_type:complete